MPLLTGEARLKTESPEPPIVPLYWAISTVPLPMGRLVTFTLMVEAVVSEPALTAGMELYWPPESLRLMVAPPLKVNDDSVSDLPAVLLGVKSRMPPSFT